MITKFVYANSFLTSFNYDDSVLDIIKKYGKLDNLTSYNNRFEDVPDSLIEVSEDSYAGFINGIVYSQYTNSLNSDSYLNPLLIGLSLDYKKWVNILKNDNRQREIVYVDVPYEEYVSLVPSEVCITQEEYTKHSDGLKKLVNALNESLRVTLH